MKEVLLIITSCVSLTYQEGSKPVEVCENIRTLDEDVFQELQKPGPLNQYVLFEKIKKYISAVGDLLQCLKNDKEGTYKVAKDIIDKKGASFVVDLPWNYFIARTDFGWGSDVLDEFLHHRLEVQEAWLQVTKLFDPTADIV